MGNAKVGKNKIIIRAHVRFCLPLTSRIERISIAFAGTFLCQQSRERSASEGRKTSSVSAVLAVQFNFFLCHPLNQSSLWVVVWVHREIPAFESALLAINLVVRQEVVNAQVSASRNVLTCSLGEALGLAKTRRFELTVAVFIFTVTLGRNQPLKKERPPWTSEMPLTEGQLRSKREEFWETAPAFEGRKEIWDALRAAAETDDHTWAQAIVDGANITLPTGES